jgi:hypothetical protein
MPKSLYKQSRRPGNANPNPLLLTETRHVQTSEQITDYVFCEECERRLNDNGERYTMSQVAKENGTFPLLETLMKATPIQLGEDEIAFTAKSTPDINRDALAYYALSIFWRASVHNWERDRQEPRINLGPYNETIRRFLMGETPFPDNISLLMVVCNDPESQNVFYTPSLGMKQLERTYSFQTRGLNFLMIVGKKTRADTRKICLVNGPERLIVVRSCKEKLEGGFARLLKYHE